MPRKLTWLPGRPKRSAAAISPAFKAEVEKKGKELVEAVLKPGLKSLQFLDLFDTQVTTEGVEELRKALPNTTIYGGVDGQRLEPGYSEKSAILLRAAVTNEGDGRLF